jgi:ferrous iron transport protein B
LTRALTAYGINPVVHSLIIDGVFAGVGSVLSFLPIIVVLFFFLSILEDTGYMARVAFVMDKLLRKIGLSGRSFVPMLIGFGCSVPAIMATRTLSSDRDRKMTILLTPYMSCSAKIPIYAVFTAAFFPKDGALVMICLLSRASSSGILVALLLKGTRFRGQPVPFVMELPNYRLPSAKSVGLLLWDKAKDFLQRAFSIIFIATVISGFCRPSIPGSTWWPTARPAFWPSSAASSRRYSRRWASPTGASPRRSSPASRPRRPWCPP